MTTLVGQEKTFLMAPFEQNVVQQIRILGTGAHTDSLSQKFSISAGIIDSEGI